MREVVVSRDESHRLSIQLALDAAGIPFEARPAIASEGHYVRARFFVADRDFERAQVLVNDLLSSNSPQFMTRPMKIMMALWALLFLAAIVVGVFRH